MCQLRNILVLFILFSAKVHCDDGLCGIEPPKQGESCSGTTTAEIEAKIKATVDEKGDSNTTEFQTYKYEEKPMTDEEKELWAKRYYSKRM